MAELTRRTFLGVAATALTAATGCSAAGDLLEVGPSVRVAVPWSANELAAFRAILANLGIEEYRVDPIPLGDNIDAAFGARSAGRPDIVMLPRIGLLRQHAADLEPLPARLWEPWPYPPVWDRLVFLPNRRTGRPYGLPFKVADASVVWYRRRLFAEHGLSPPRTWHDWLHLNDRLIRLGVAPLAVSSADGWMLTYVLANLVHAVCGPAAYEQLAQPADPRYEADLDRHARAWTDDAVVHAFTLFGDMLGRPGAIAGGVDVAETRQFPDAVVDVFAYHRAAMLIAPDFAESVIRQFADPADAGVFAFPEVPDLERRLHVPHVLAGDVAVVTRGSSEQARDLVARLATPEAPKPWIQRYGGFLSANPGTPTSLYSPALRPMAERMIEHERGEVFDISDALGPVGTDEGLWRVLQDLLVRVGRGADPADAAVESARRMAGLVRSGVA